MKICYLPTSKNNNNKNHESYEAYNLVKRYYYSNIFTTIYIEERGRENRNRELRLWRNVRIFPSANTFSFRLQSLIISFTRASNKTNKTKLNDRYSNDGNISLSPTLICNTRIPFSSSTSSYSVFAFSFLYFRNETAVRSVFSRIEPYTNIHTTTFIYLF